MAAAAQPTSHMLACDIVPGQSADDPLYLPLIRRVRQQLRQHGLLYTGDCKMSALATRAELVAEKDYYLMPLPRTGDGADQIEAWVEEAALGKQPLQNLTRINEKGKRIVFARITNGSGRKVAWSTSERLPGASVCKSSDRWSWPNVKPSSWTSAWPRRRPPRLIRSMTVP